MKNKHQYSNRNCDRSPEINRDLIIANKMSRRIHDCLSRIRLSLTFRIALHYCVQLLRSFIPVCVFISFLFAIAVSFPVNEKLHDLTASDSGEKHIVVKTENLLLYPTDETAEDSLFSRIRQQTGLIFSNKLLKKQLWFYYTDESGKEWKVCLLTDLIIRCWLYILAGLLVADLCRIIYFFRHDQRISKRVLAPIRDIASMAATLSENNLSNRINIAGTKNELKDLAQVINLMLDRIERSYNSQKQFVSDASHELRTPISVIRGYTDMLKRWGKDDPEILEEGISAILQETEDMKDLVESLLFLARHDKKALMMEKTIFAVDDLLAETQKEEQMVHESYHFVSILPAEKISINADRKMIKQVIRILCDNAVKYSNQHAEIVMECGMESDGYCYIAVKDNGQGISSEDLPHIFDRFYRSDKARKAETGGHGLGLSIAKIIVLAHGGKIKVRSKLEQGTTFSILLPADTD